MLRPLLCGLLLTACADDGAEATSSVHEEVEALRAELDLPSLVYGVVRAEGLVEVGATGWADLDSEAPATEDTIYLIASCSKPVVGLAVALLGDRVDLDADVNDYLEWAEPLENPDYPEEPVTLRQLLTHTSSLSGDTEAYYDTYPKPDPDEALDLFLERELAEEGAWRPQAPGEAEHYSNLGASLVGLVVEKVAGQSLPDFTRVEIFDPLGMDDTAWRYDAFDAEQQARIARPHDEGNETLEHYGFNDYPSGLLRTTIGDLARLLIALAGDGLFEGERVFEAEAVEAFEEVPMLLEAEDGVFSHDGGEAGAFAHFTYREDGSGELYFGNASLDDMELDATQARVEAILQGVP